MNDEEYLIRTNARFLGLRLIKLYSNNLERYYEYQKNLIEDFGIEFYNEYLKWHEEKLEVLK